MKQRGARRPPAATAPAPRTRANALPRPRPSGTPPGRGAPQSPRGGPARPAHGPLPGLPTRTGIARAVPRGKTSPRAASRPPSPPGSSRQSLRAAVNLPACRQYAVPAYRTCAAKASWFRRAPMLRYQTRECAPYFFPAAWEKTPRDARGDASRQNSSPGGADATKERRRQVPDVASPGPRSCPSLAGCRFTVAPHSGNSSALATARRHGQSRNLHRHPDQQPAQRQS